MFIISRLSEKLSYESHEPVVSFRLSIFHRNNTFHTLIRTGQGAVNKEWQISH